MKDSFFSDLRCAVEFSDQDAANVRELGSLMASAVPAIVDRFYARLLAETETRALLEQGERSIGSLRGTLMQWFHDLFEGRYDAAYYEKRKNIGEAHVRIGLPQHFMFTGMQFLQESIEEHLRRTNHPEVLGNLSSLRKLLVLDLAVMLESYKEAYSDQVRRVEQRAVEARLTEAEHLAQIGQLAASLAHEIKNPLAGISGAIQIIRDAMSEADPHRPVLQEVLGQINRLDATVRDLLNYARPTPPKVARVSLDAVVKRVLAILREEPSLQRVRIEYKRSHAGMAVFADEAQLEQVLMNLILNAAHASEDGGVIRLDVGQDGTHAQLVIADQGRGMTHEVLQRAFEPFYTTKAKGTGLGLSIVRRIIEAHDGKVDLRSEVGHGTTVTVKLPHSSERSAGRSGR